MGVKIISFWQIGKGVIVVFINKQIQGEGGQMVANINEENYSFCEIRGGVKSELMKYSQII